MRLMKHFAFAAAALFVCLGIPCLYFLQAGTLFRGADAVSGASLDVPDKPSGTFLILLNRERHPLTAEEWEAFFSEQEVGVIMEDVHCLITRGDVSGKELADRYRARLAENQMTVAEEDGTLVVSRAENGQFDVILISTDAAEIYDYSRIRDNGETMLIEVGGEEA